MRRIFLLLAVLLVSAGSVAATATGRVGQFCESAPGIDLSSVLEPGPADSVLVTGWYYIVDTATAYQRTLEVEKETWYLLGTPIVTAENFASIELVEPESGEPWNRYLGIQLDSAGTRIWSEATASWIDRRMGLIVDNRLVFAPVVRSQIEQGRTAITGSTITRQELLEIRRQLLEQRR